MNRTQRWGDAEEAIDWIFHPEIREPLLQPNYQQNNSRPPPIQDQLESALSRVIYDSDNLWCPEINPNVQNSSSDPLKNIGNQYINSNILTHLDTEFRDPFLEKIRRSVEKSWFHFSQDSTSQPISIDVPKMEKNGTSKHHIICTCGRLDQFECTFPWEELQFLRGLADNLESMFNKVNDTLKSLKRMRPSKKRNFVNRKSRKITGSVSSHKVLQRRSNNVSSSMSSMSSMENCKASRLRRLEKLRNVYKRFIMKAKRENRNKISSSSSMSPSLFQANKEIIIQKKLSTSDKSSQTDFPVPETCFKYPLLTVPPKTSPFCLIPNHSNQPKPFSNVQQWFPEEYFPIQQSTPRQEDPWFNKTEITKTAFHNISSPKVQQQQQSFIKPNTMNTYKQTPLQPSVIPINPWFKEHTEPISPIITPENPWFKERRQKIPTLVEMQPENPWFKDSIHKFTPFVSQMPQIQTSPSSMQQTPKCHGIKTTPSTSSTFSIWDPSSKFPSLMESTTPSPCFKKSISKLPMEPTLKTSPIMKSTRKASSSSFVEDVQPKISSQAELTPPPPPQLPSLMTLSPKSPWFKEIVLVTNKPPLLLEQSPNEPLPRIPSLMELQIPTPPTLTRKKSKSSSSRPSLLPLPTDSFVTAEALKFALSKEDLTNNKYSPVIANLRKPMYSETLLEEKITPKSPEEVPQELSTSPTVAGAAFLKISTTTERNDHKKKKSQKINQKNKDLIRMLLDVPPKMQMTPTISLVNFPKSVNKYSDPRLVPKSFQNQLIFMSDGIISLSTLSSINNLVSKEGLDVKGNAEDDEEDDDESDSGGGGH